MSELTAATAPIAVVTQPIPTVQAPIAAVSRPDARSVTTATWRNAVFAVFGLTGIATASWIARIPEIRDQLGIGSSAVAVLLVGLAFGSVVGLLIAPRLAAHLGVPRVLMCGLVAIASGLVLVGFTVDMLHSEPATLAALAWLGCSLSTTSVSMNLDGASVEKRSRRTLLPLMHAFFSGGTIVGALLGALAAARHLPVLVSLASVSAVVIVGAVVALRALPRATHPIRRHEPTGANHTGHVDITLNEPAPAFDRSVRGRITRRLGVLADPRLVVLGIMMAAMSFVEGSANDWISLAAVDGHGMSKANGALVYTVFVLSMTVGRVIGGPAVDRFGRGRVLTSVAGTAVVGVMLFILGQNMVIVMIGTALWGLGASLAFPIGMSLAADHATQSARRVGVVSVFGYSASLVGPPAIGMLAERVGILEAFLLVLAMLVVSLLAIRSAEPHPTTRTTTVRVSAATASETR